jgi:luciferase family oxidoreductase group 1
MEIPLSILDISPVDSGSTASQALQNTLALAHAADRLGYARYWLAEHHNTTAIASSAPEILIEAIAGATSRIRVGSGGIMLPNHAPLKVAETFRVLEALHPGRIDLGLGRAPGTDPITAMALRRSTQNRGGSDFPAQLSDLLAFSGHGVTSEPMFRTINASPSDIDLPPIWLLGSSGETAPIAGQRGMGFAFAYHINPSLCTAQESIESYRASFVMSEQFAKPRVMLTVGVVCAETESEAADLAATVHLTRLRFQNGRPAPIPSPSEAASYPYSDFERMQIAEFEERLISGTPDKVRARLLDLVQKTGADELMLTTIAFGHENRVRSYELLSREFGL